ncbi:MAG: SAM-dependent methyltransferase [Paracoccaceae bacterium]
MNSLVDPIALARNRARATDMFLQSLAADELQDRLGMVNKEFSAPAIVTPFPNVWSDRIPNATVVPAQDVLTLERSTHDLVIHSLDLHWANDPVGQLIQCKRALQPDGLLLVAALGGQTLSELRTSLAEAETRVTSGLSARVAPMAEIRDLGALLQRAGLALPVADSVVQNVEYEDLTGVMQDLRRMGETNALSARLRVPTKRAVFDTAAQIYAQHFSAQSGKVCATYEFVILTGWAPDDSQPQPLRPGSATQRLADALGAQEKKIRN